MADSWVNWGDFVGANSEQLAQQDKRVVASQEQQQAAMQAALDRLGSAYDSEASDVEADYKAQTDALYDPTSAYNNPTPAGTSTLGAPAQGGRMDAASGSPYSGLGVTGSMGRVGGTPAGGGAGGGNMQRTDQRSADSYAALMAASNDAEMNAFKGYQSSSAPGWQNALYESRTQYTDPWADLQSKVDPMTEKYATRQTRAKDAYEAAEKARREQAQTTTKPTGTDVDGNPTYGTQVDEGPRNVPIKDPEVIRVRAS